MARVMGKDTVGLEGKSLAGEEGGLAVMVVVKGQGEAAGAVTHRVLHNLIIIN